MLSGTATPTATPTGTLNASQAVASRKGILRLGLPLLGLMLLQGCGDGGGGPVGPTPPDGPAAPQEAPAPTLSTSQLAPLAPVVLSGLPANREDLLADVTPAGTSSAGVEGTFLVPLLPLGADRYELRVPLHPTNGVEGGAVDVRVRGDSLVTRAAALTLAPYTPAPGAFAHVLDRFQHLLDLHMAELGMTRAQLLDPNRDPAADPALIPLALAQTLLEDPSHDRDMRDFLAGSSAFDFIRPPTAGDRDAIDRIMGASGLADVVEQDIAAAQARLEALGLDPRNLGDPDAQGFLSISSASDLDGAMRRAWDAHKAIDPNTARGEFWTALGFSLGVVGIVGGLPGEIFAVTAGTATWAYHTYLDGTSKLYPREFVGGSFSFVPSIDRFKEDEAGPGEWTNVLVSARSEGWSLDKAQMGLALQVAGGLSAYATWAGKVTSAGAKLASDMNTLFQGLLLNHVPDGPGDTADVPARTWGPIDITGPEWTDARVAGSAIRVTSGTYVPEAVGDALLTVETRVTRFGDAQVAFDRETITVEAIEMRFRVDGLEWLPERRTVKVGDEVTLDLFVENALDDSVDWTLSAGSWSQAPTRVGEGHWRGRVQTPDEQKAFPVIVQATSTATGGARSAPGAPERLKRLRLLAIEVLVEPISAILERGESQQFEATVLGAEENTSVTWTAFGPDGQPVAIGSNGLFTAPSTFGDYLIVATSVEDPEAEGFANVTVAGVCRWTLTISGPSGGRWSGTEAGFIYAGATGPSTNFGIYFSRGDEDPLIGLVQGSGPEIAGQVGSFSPAALLFSPAIGIQWTPMEGGTLTVIRNESDVMTATANGRVFTVEPGPTIIEADWLLTFRGINGLGDLDCSE